MVCLSGGGRHYLATNTAAGRPLETVVGQYTDWAASDWSNEDGLGSAWWHWPWDMALSLHNGI